MTLSIQAQTVLAAQQSSYSTFEQASADPLVVELLGQGSLDQLKESYEAQAAARNISSRLANGTNQSFEIGGTVTEMADQFMEQRWTSDAERFDAETFLLSVCKLKILKENVSDPIIEQGIDGTYRRLRYALNREPTLFWLDWNLNQMKGSENQSLVKSQMVDRDFFIVPYACQEMLTPENWLKYQACHQLALKVAGVGQGGKLGNGSGYAAMSAAAEKAAQAWYQKQSASFNAKDGAEATQFRKAFFKANLESMLYRKAGIALTKLKSHAKSQYNDANNGLKYAQIGSQKALESAKASDAANALSYMKDARESAVKLAEATSQLSESVRRAKQFKKYMIGAAATRTQRANVGELTVEKLRECHRSQPSGGNANVVARNTLQEMIVVTQSINEIEGWLAEATKKCGNIDEALRAGEESLARITEEDNSNSGATFDISSREAFEASMEKMSGSLPTEQAVALTQAWVKILQEAIKEDPMVMADDAKFRKFLKEKFEGKTAKDIIGQ